MLVKRKLETNYTMPQMSRGPKRRNSSDLSDTPARDEVSQRIKTRKLSSSSVHNSPSSDPKLEFNTAIALQPCEVEFSTEIPSMQCILKAIQHLPEPSEGKKRLIYIGIGTANSTGSTFGNPSLGYANATTLKAQQHPPFLSQAKEEGYQVISINIDNFESMPHEVNLGTSEIKEEDGHYKLTISTAFPLTAKGNIQNIQTIADRLNAKKGPQGEIVIMNSVNNLDYHGILLLSSQTGGTYLKSHLQTGTTLEVYKPPKIPKTQTVCRKFLTQSKESLPIGLHNRNLDNFLRRH